VVCLHVFCFFFSFAPAHFIIEFWVICLHLNEQEFNWIINELHLTIPETNLSNLDHIYLFRTGILIIFLCGDTWDIKPKYNSKWKECVVSPVFVSFTTS
jgi:hypothetical protein